MPSRGAEYKRNISNEAIINALIQFGTVREAAESIGCKPRTIYNRMNNDNEFIEEYNAAKKDITRKAVASFNNKINLAIEEIFSIMQDKNVNAAIRLQAAQTILNSGNKFAERLEKIEAAQIEEDEKVYFESGFPLVQKNANSWEPYTPFIKDDDNEIDYRF